MKLDLDLNSLLTTPSSMKVELLLAAAVLALAAAVLVLAWKLKR